MAQLAPVFNIIAGDFGVGGKADILLCGNDYGAEVSNGRLDGLDGLVLSGNNKGSFYPLLIKQSGFFIPGDARSMVKVKNKNGGDLYIISQNKWPLKVYVLKNNI